MLDGAYAEYVSNFDGGASLVQDRENVFMTRTFSKMYGLGGLRIGWGMVPSISLIFLIASVAHLIYQQSHLLQPILL